MCGLLTGTTHRGCDRDDRLRGGGGLPLHTEAE